MGAGKRALACVHHLVALQAAELAEAFPALDALVRLLASMDALVDPKLALVSVTSRTKHAGVREAKLL